MQKQYLSAKGRRTVIRILYAVLIGTFAIGSAGQMATAQAALAAGDPVPVKFEIGVYPEKLPKICTKGKLNLYAGVHKSVSKKIGDTVWNLDGHISEPPHIDGSLIRGSGELKKQLQDIDDPTGTSVPFVFTADKPGRVTLKFTASVKNSWVGANEEVIGSGVTVQKEVTFTVAPCKYKVKTVLKFPVPDLYKITVISDDALMKADETGSFTGSATMAWVYSEVFQDCDFSISATDSQADLAGQLDDDGGQLAVTQNFHPTTVAILVCCPIVGCRNASDQGSVDPLIFSIASTGGVVTQTVTGQGVSGLATIVVIPEEDEAVAFNAGSRAVLSSSAWWARLWDDFPWSYSALRALH
ncbi:MAG: hypothetical protein M3R47_16435 [Chloroflexota bacterium]|nr:hypothetical protein [Chloroflexota bacterium]